MIVPHDGRRPNPFSGHHPPGPLDPRGRERRINRAFSPDPSPADDRTACWPQAESLFGAPSAGVRLTRRNGARRDIAAAHGKPRETGTFRRPLGLRLSRAVLEDCNGSRSIIRQLAVSAAEDGLGRPAARRVRLLAPVRGGGGVRAAVVELVARCAGAWVEVRDEGEC